MILLVGNWKAAPDKKTQAEKLLKSTSVIVKAVKKKIMVVVCVPTVHLGSLAKKNPNVNLGAQNVSLFSDIAHTGQNSAAMLKEAGAKYCIIGHSECRALGEENNPIAQKALRLLEKNITPIFCVGEVQRDVHGWYLSTIKDQLASVFSLLSPDKAKKIVIAYEPVWAIGAKATREATPTECQEMMLFIRKIITDTYSTKIAQTIPLLYGGSVTEENAQLFISQGEANGLLVGRVSLEAKRFGLLAKKIAEYTKPLKK